jgi:hypothetical protein
MADRQLDRFDAARRELAAARAMFTDATHDLLNAERELTVAASALAARTRLNDHDSGSDDGAQPLHEPVVAW